MGGSKTKTVTDVQVVGLLDDFDQLHQDIILNAGRRIGSGFDVVRSVYGKFMVDLKSIYNDSFLDAMGFNPSENVVIKLPDKENILAYTQVNIDGTAVELDSAYINTIGIHEIAIEKIQQYPNYDYETKGFDYLGKRYYFLYAVRNGSIIDLVVYLDLGTTVVANKDTAFQSYLDTLQVTSAEASATVSQFFSTSSLPSNLVYNRNYSISSSSIDLNCYEKGSITVNNYCSSTYPAGYTINSYSKSGSSWETNVTYAVVTTTTTTYTTKTVSIPVVYLTYPISYTIAKTVHSVTVPSRRNKPILQDGVYVIAALFNYDMDKSISYSADSGFSMVVNTREISTVTLYIPIVLEYLSVSDSSVNEFAARLATVPTRYSVELMTSTGYQTYNIVVNIVYTGAFNYTIDVVYSIPELPSYYIWDKKEAIENIEALKIDYLKIVWYYRTPSNTFIHFVNRVGNNSLTKEKELSAFPLITIKKNKAIVDNKKLDIVLDKIAVTTDDFAKSLKDGKIHDAYLGFSVPLGTETESGISYLVDYFVALSGGTLNTQGITSSATVSFNKLNMRQEYYIKGYVMDGATHPIGHAWKATEYARSIIYRSPSGDDSEYSMYKTYTTFSLNKQVTPSTYYRLVVLKVKSTYTVGIATESFVHGYAPVEEEYFDNPTRSLAEIRIPLFRDLIQTMPFPMYCQLFEVSLAMTFNTIQTVKIKWYQTGFFKFIMIIATVVLSYFSFGAAGSLGKAIVVAGAVTGVAGLMGIDLGVLGDIIAVIGIVYGISVIVKTGITTAMQAVNAANVLIQIPTMITRISHASDIKSLQSKIAQQTVEMEELQEEQKEDDAMQRFKEGGLLMTGASIEPSTYYDLAVGNYNQYTLMYDTVFDYDVYYKTA